MRFIKKAGSLKITVFLLLSIALGSALGTLIIQGQDGTFYINYYGDFWGGIISRFGLDNFYDTFLFNALIAALGLNLILCNLNKFKPGHLKTRRKSALLLLHFSVLAIFTGAVISKHTRYARSYRLLADDKIILPAKTAEVVFKNFMVKFYPRSKRPQDYCTNVAVYSGRQLIGQRQIRVNHPLKILGYNFYQSSFETLADMDLMVRHSGKIVAQGRLRQGEVMALSGPEGINLEILDFLPDIIIRDDNKIVPSSHHLDNSACLFGIFKGEELIEHFWVFKDAVQNNVYPQPAPAFEVEIKNTRMFYASVIEVVKDPGLGFIWSGFIMLGLGSVLILI
ncbi:MAG: cytochrome c biogenesis protein ResB [Candidatus Omnitrophica bacterium]|nr:cytochrome c biogenesis protein ResB [Candidatus Omnitrophota bacterium]MBU1926022.1 cytochrome c biogenesis protein ResB [Candidatus Omnitrophota bacterium]